MKLRSYAKINLTLDIQGRRPDGYHDLKTVFQQVSLFDEIEILPRNDGRVVIGCSLKELENEDNICFIAARIMQERFGIRQGVSISIKKNIPVGAGLGGGSSNAAAVLKGMNHIFKLRLGSEDLRRVSAEIGMDVAYHIAGGTCLGSGRGEIIEKIKPFPKWHVVIVYPGFSISTREAYQSLAYDHVAQKNSTAAFIRDYNCAFIHNDFEYSILPLYPELAHIKENLGHHSLLSGSGSCVFGLYQNREEAMHHYHRIKHTYRQSFLAETIHRSVVAAAETGFCFGVTRALDEIMSVKDEEGVHVLGSLVHNDQVIQDLRARGIGFVDHPKDVERGTVVISAHGVADSVRDEIEKRNVRVRDLTCPVVLRLHRMTKQKDVEGKRVVILGDAAHPEVCGVAGNLSNYKVVRSIDDMTTDDFNSGIFFVSQTTADAEKFDMMADAIRRKSGNAEIADTICAATRFRQKNAVELARRSDFMLVIGGKRSANTARLFEICSQYSDTRQVETEDDLDPDWFPGKTQIGIAAGASTPDWIIENITDRIHMLL